MTIKVHSKYFIGYNDYKIGIVPLYIILPEINASAKYFKDSRCMNFLVNDKKVLQKYNEIWDEVKGLLKEKFSSELVYKDKFIKTQVYLFNTPFLCKKIPKESECCTCVSIILLILLLILIKNILLQVLLEEIFKKILCTIR